MQNSLSGIRSLGAELVAISPQRPEFLRQMKEKHDLEFPILRDSGNEVAEKFGVRHAVPDFLREVYLEFGIDLPRVNGEGSWTLPAPARYVVDGNGKVVSAIVEADYRYRPESSRSIRDLEELNRRT
ncbi:MAG: redoxin domain-containing protein [Acidobacteriota bacterium]|nr:MAG: redoxin domain-containing protein [Acidobacteriota bacterium]